MSNVSAEELYTRLADQYTATELVDVLGVTTQDLEDMGIVDFISGHWDELIAALESLDIHVV